MDYSLIIRPLIGAAIGYVTNWIAVKMLFFPLNPVKIGKFTLPFTPGVIPKNKERLAQAIGNSISDNLVNADTLKDALLSDSMKADVREIVVDFLNGTTDVSASVDTLLTNYLNTNNYDQMKDKIVTNLSQSILQTVKDANLGPMIAEQIELAAKENFKGSLLGLLGGNAVVGTISRGASEKITEYIDQEGEKVISDMVSKELDKYTSSSLSDITTKIGTSEINLVDIMMNIYEKFIINNLPPILKLIDISSVVTDRINTMEASKIEELVLKIINKELNTLVNLGAIIGFILGLINLFI
ncbi:MAG: DUF445 family protein [Clostridia bacterium]|nr:DUF445 family protein [Clostridia bacterium]